MFPLRIVPGAFLRQPARMICCKPSGTSPPSLQPLVRGALTQTPLQFSQLRLQTSSVDLKSTSPPSSASDVSGNIYDIPSLSPPWQLSDLCAWEREAYAEHGPDYASRLEGPQRRYVERTAGWRANIAAHWAPRLGPDWYAIYKEAWRRACEREPALDRGRAAAKERKDEIYDVLRRAKTLLGHLVRAGAAADELEVQKRIIHECEAGIGEISREHSAITLRMKVLVGEICEEIKREREVQGAGAPVTSGAADS